MSQRSSRRTRDQHTAALVGTLLLAIVMPFSLLAALTESTDSGQVPVADLEFRRTEDRYVVDWPDPEEIQSADTFAVLRGEAPIPIEGQITIRRRDAVIDSVFSGLNPVFRQTQYEILLFGRQGLEFFTWPTRHSGPLLAEREEAIADRDARREQYASASGREAMPRRDLDSEIPLIVEAAARVLDENGMSDDAIAMRNGGGTQEVRDLRAAATVGVLSFAPSVVVLAIGVPTAIRRLRASRRSVSDIAEDPARTSVHSRDGDQT